MTRRRLPGAQTRTVRAAIIVADPTQPGLLPEERLALTLRRDATVSGRCVCGATLPPLRVRRGKFAAVEMRHEPDCPAAGPQIERIAHRLGNQLVFETIVAELRLAA